jgi:hypothetical protein
MKKLLMMAALAGASLMLARSAEAGLLTPCHCVGRHLGLCWGDGYHARCDCGNTHGLLGCRLFSHGHGGKCKTHSKGFAPVATGYPAEEVISSDEVPTPPMQP